MKLTQINVFNLDGGLNTAHPATMIAEQDGTHVKNVVFDKGVVKAMPYKTTVIENSGDVIYNNLRSFNGIVQTFVMSSSGVGLLDRDKQIQPLIVSEDKKWGFTTALNHAIISNGIDSNYLWSLIDGLRPLEIPYYTNTLVYYKEHLLMLGLIDHGSTVGQRVRWSATGTIDDWTGHSSHFVDLIDDTSHITGVGLLSDFLIIYKQNSIILCQYSGSATTFSFRTIHNNIGLTDANMLSVMQDKHIFVYDDKVYLLSLSGIVVISDKVSNKIQNITSVSNLIHNKYVLFNTKDVNETMCFNIENNTWSLWNIDTFKSAGSILHQPNLYYWDKNPYTCWSSAKDERWNSNDLTIEQQDVIYVGNDMITFEHDIDSMDGWCWQSKDFTAPPEFIRADVRWQEVSLEVNSCINTVITLSVSTNGGLCWQELTNTLVKEIRSDWTRYTWFVDLTSPTLRVAISILSGRAKVRWLQLRHIRERVVH